MWRSGRAILHAIAAVVSPLALVAAIARAPQEGTGRIEGRVRLTAAGPRNPPIRMGVDPACSRLYGTTRPEQPFVVRDESGGLANVFVHLRGEFPDAPPPPASPVVLEQRGCMYLPHVIGVQAGQKLEVRNADPTSHNVHAVSQRENPFNVTQARGAAPVVFAMQHEELMLRLTCDVHSWMNVFVGVVRHPYFAVSATDGRFSIDNVPMGDHRLEAWHERFGPLSAEAHVESGTTTTVDFTFSGSERPAVPVAAIEVPATTFAFR